MVKLYLHGIIQLVTVVCVALTSAQAEPIKRYNYYKNLPTDGARRTGVTAAGSNLTLNGKPLRLISGAMHYFRIVPQYWRNRLALLKAAGCNAVETYVPWNLHEPSPGHFDFEGILDVRRYIEIAAELDLMVIFRPGPYICAEWEFGGMPSWLLADDNMKVRSSYAPYVEASDRFLQELIPRIANLQFSQSGGPIIMVQIENEYGGFDQDRRFMDTLRDSLKRFGVTEMLFTSDGPNDLAKGQASDVWLTVNEQTNMGDALDKLTAIQPNKPLMVMEYWSGWFDHWTEHHQTTSMEKFSSELTTILARGASVNFYMFHGGTNFAFMNGANMGLFNVSAGYQPTITSYDYDALVSEDGRVTQKWHKTRELLAQFGLLPEELQDPTQNAAPKSLGRMQVDGWLPLTTLNSFFPSFQLESPLWMEKLKYKPSGQSYGFIAYERILPESSGELLLGEMHDRALILVEGQQHALIDFAASLKKAHTIKLTNSVAGQKVTILVENMGRVNYGNSADSQRKGLMGQVTLNGKPLTGWTVRPMEFTSVDVAAIFNPTTAWDGLSPSTSVPACFRFTLNLDEEPTQDTFLGMEGWGRGVAFVNGFNLGRYWPTAGPTKTMYVPAPLLKKGRNTFILFELHTVDNVLQSVAQPNLGPVQPHQPATSMSPQPSSSPSSHHDYLFYNVLAAALMMLATITYQH
ncbi:hypothetical protein RvY_00067 [Ramazzottius varieornatus]|uniref:Beta-galactosidase n=1 Tax=Ramazzottius varieornatus TaxID=947166 RepID=A0A1D1UIW0_RAMVA|nr:hypothetical protein RvY_00067 [Ramazzottius varieornatus]